jgi:hypothetical protein
VIQSQRSCHLCSYANQRFLFFFHQILLFMKTTKFLLVLVVENVLCRRMIICVCACACIVCYVYIYNFFVQLLKLLVFFLLMPLLFVLHISSSLLRFCLFVCFTSIFSLCYVSMRMLVFTPNDKSSLLCFFSIFTYVKLRWDTINKISAKRFAECRAYRVQQAHCLLSNVHEFHLSMCKAHLH